MKRKTLISSILVIVLCLGLISGSTYALFTSESSVNIAVTSGKVNVVATIDPESLKVYSATTELVNPAVEAGTLEGTFAGTYYYKAMPVDENNVGTFANGGTAKLSNENTVLTIDKITPGDKVTVKVNVENNSNVKTKYRIRVNVLDGETLEDQAKSLKLFEGLTVKVGTNDAEPRTATELNGVIRVSDWYDLAARGDNDNLVDIPVEILLPLAAGNEYQDLKTEIQITVEAVQSNAATNTELELINAFLATKIPTTMNAAIKSLVGAQITGLTTLADYAAAFEKVGSYLWNVDTNQFYAESDATDFAYKYFKVYEAMPTTVQTYSIYAGSSWTAPTVDTLTVGFDAGETSNITSVTYDRSTATDERDVVIRTNGGTLTINAPLDTVRHYGEADSVNIVAVASSSYHENGTVKFVEISKGRMALETGAELNHIHINAKVVNDVKQDVFDNIIIAKANDVTMPEFSRDDVEIATAGTLVVALQTGTEEITESTELDYVWLTKQGVYEQITVSENNTSAGTTWVNTSNKPAETKTAAQQIANNIGATATVGGEIYNVSVDANRDIVLKDTTSGNVAYTLETQSDGSTVLKDDNDEVVDSNVATVATVVAEAVEAQPSKESAKAAATMFAGGNGTQEKPYMIANANQWNNFYQMVYDANLAGKTPYFELANDINLAGFEIKNYAKNSNNEIIYDHDMNFVLDGKGHSVLYIETLMGYKQPFPYIVDTTIKNITIDYNLVNRTQTCAMTYNCYGDCYFINVTTTGKIETTANWASAFVAYPFDTNGGSITYRNCTSYTNLTANFTGNAYVAPFGSHTMSITSVVLENCKNYGTVAGGHASAFIGMTGGNSSRYTVSNLENYGKIIYSEANGSGGLFTFGSHTLNNNVVAKETSSVEKLPSVLLEFNDDNKLVIKDASSTYDYRIIMSVSTHLYGYNGDNNWRGAFPRSLTKVYSNISGDYATEYERTLILESAGQRLNYSGDEQEYHGIYAPNGVENAATKLESDNEVIKLVYYDGKTFYYYDESNNDGTSYHALVTSANGAETGEYTGTITITFTVEQLLNGATTSSGNLTYTFNVADAATYFSD